MDVRKAYIYVRRREENPYVASRERRAKWRLQLFIRCVRVFHQPGLSGKTVPELEKTVGLMKKVVERVQRENETLKKSSASAALQQENLRLKVGRRF